MAQNFKMFIYQGCQYPYSASYNSVLNGVSTPRDLTGYSALGNIYQDYTKTNLLLQFTPTITPLTGTLSFTLTPTQTLSLAPTIIRPKLGDYQVGVYDIIIYTAGNSAVEMWSQGEVWVLAGLSGV